VVADDTPAVEAVMRADKERWALLEEEQRLLKELDTNPDDAKDARLAEVRGDRDVGKGQTEKHTEMRRTEACRGLTQQVLASFPIACRSPCRYR
jgi:ATP-binding cassette subfamily F protein 1